MTKDPLHKLKTLALNESKMGRFAQAVKIQIDVINKRQKSGAPPVEDDHLRLAGYLFQFGDLKGALTALENAFGLFPQSLGVQENLGIVLLRLRQMPKAIEHLEAVNAMTPDKANVLDALAHAYGGMGNFEKSRKFGEQSLITKDRDAGAPIFALKERTLPKFNFSAAAKNIISFSLFGAKDRYIKGAIRNAELVEDIYPGWQCRFYCGDDVPSECLTKLKELGADVRQMRQANPYDGLFWRFLVAEDSNLDRFLIRDCDSVINIRERVAVDEWLASDKPFHLMRDYHSHTDLILAGMWGGVAGILPPLNKMLSAFQSNKLATANVDQWFLREMVWPLIRDKVFIHDRHYRCFNARDFPVVGGLPPNRHVGQNVDALVKHDKAKGSPNA